MPCKPGMDPPPNLSATVYRVCTLESSLCCTGQKIWTDWLLKSSGINMNQVLMIIIETPQSCIMLTKSPTSTMMPHNIRCQNRAPKPPSVPKRRRQSQIWIPSHTKQHKLRPIPMLLLCKSEKYLQHDVGNVSGTGNQLSTVAYE